MLDAIAELKYVPSAVTRSLKNNRTHTFGLMIPNSSNPYFAEIIRGIEDTCFQAGFNVTLCNSDDDPKKQGQYIRVLSETQVDGLIVFSSGGDDELGEHLLRAGMPHVLVDREVEHLNADLIEVNHESGGYPAAIWRPSICWVWGIAALPASAGRCRCRPRCNGLPATGERSQKPACGRRRRCCESPTSPARAGTLRCSTCSACASARQRSSPATT